MPEKTHPSRRGQAASISLWAAYATHKFCGRTGLDLYYCCGTYSVTPSFTCAQSMRKIPLSLKIKP